ncbi:MAG: GNAT family protein [Halioglobus sp.]
MIELDVRPVTLEGESVRLEPLSQEHAQGLYSRGRYEPDWAYMPRACFVDAADVRHWINEALLPQDQLVFAIMEKGKGRVAGSTRYLNIRGEHRSLEIGWTWLGQDFQRSVVNTETKLLLLGHAFEKLGCIRVEFKTDSRNLRSQQALERIGATREGVLRKHMIVQEGYHRDSVYFSVTEDEWPEIKQRLQKLSRRRDD